MRRLSALLPLLAFLLFPSVSQAQTTNGLCVWALVNGIAVCNNVTAGNPLPVTSGGGGGGLSVTDNVAFTYGTSPFTPFGGVYHSSITNCTDGNQCAAAITAARSVHVLDDNSAALLTAAQATTVPFTLYVAASPNSTSIKASPGYVYDVQLGGIGSVPAYVRFYDTASAPTCSSATGLVKVLIIPAASTAGLGAGSNVSIPVGVTFASGIGICVTGAWGSTDTTNPASGAYVVNVDYR